MQSIRVTENKNASKCEAKIKKKILSRCCAAQQKNYFFLKKEKECNINYLNNQYIDMSFNAVCITQSPNARTRLLKLCILNIARTHGCAVPTTPAGLGVGYPHSSEADMGFS